MLLGEDHARYVDIKPGTPSLKKNRAKEDGFLVGLLNIIFQQRLMFFLGCCLQSSRSHPGFAPWTGFWSPPWRWWGWVVAGELLGRSCLGCGLQGVKRIRANT